MTHFDVIPIQTGTTKEHMNLVTNNARWNSMVTTVKPKKTTAY